MNKSSGNHIRLLRISFPGRPIFIQLPPGGPPGSGRTVIHSSTSTPSGRRGQSSTRTSPAARASWPWTKGETLSG